MKGVSTILMVVLVALLSVVTTLGMYFSVTASNIENVRRSESKGELQQRLMKWSF